jgi:hypothetical protein
MVVWTVELNFVRLDMEENSDIKDQLNAFIQETNEKFWNEANHIVEEFW